MVAVINARKVHIVHLVKEPCRVREICVVLVVLQAHNMYLEIVPDVSVVLMGTFRDTTIPFGAKLIVLADRLTIHSTGKWEILWIKSLPYGRFLSFYGI